jgi:LuxR family maltose regulon positive regulatory protein
MSIPILSTKLYIPPPPPQVVPRPRLIEQLNAGLHRKLTLIAAPAGFGKTTLVSAWVAGCDRPVAWLALDPGDGDPIRFLTYLVTALRTFAPQLGAGVLGGLQSPQPLPTESLLTALLNDLTTIPNSFLLVLDDYHMIEAPAVDEALTFLLEHLPAQMHLVITTREDPPLPLARLRAQGHLTELRAADLRFTVGEAATFLNQIMGLDLADVDVTALETRTEGWIAGLQLAAFSMRGREDIPGFIRAFSGDHRYIVDYLVAEVLQRQPAAVRSFLLQTAILNRLHGPLCDAVTGQPGGTARLAALERGNLFVVPLDDGRHWYRYHHLFADVLAAHLRVEQPDQIATLHRRASAWYEQQGAAAEAIHHALAAADFEHAADLIERAVPAMRRSRQVATLLGWLKALPAEVVRCRPELSVRYAHALLASGELAGVEDHLRDAERWLDTPGTPEDIYVGRDTPRTGMVVVDEEAFRRVPAEIAVARAGRALMLGDVPAAVNHARRLQDLIQKDDQLGRGSAAALLGLAAWAGGDLETAQRAYADGMAHLQMAGQIADVIGGAPALADIQIAQGRLHEARRTLEQALELATEPHPAGAGYPRGAALPGTADLYVGLSALHQEWNELQAARQDLLKSQELGEHSGFPQNRYRWRVAMARLLQVQGDLDGALALLQEAERLYVRDFFPNLRPVAALKTRLWVVQGRWGEARDWARGLTARDDLSYLREFEHLTLARVLLAQYASDRAEASLQQAIRLLERLRQAAQAGERTGSIIEILVLQALAQQMQGDIAGALVPLRRALALAAPEGYVRIFVDEGAALGVLLQEAANQGIAPDYTGKLLAACGTAPAQNRPDSKPRPQVPLEPVEPLSERERQVLRLLGSELSGPEIARALMVSPNTMNTHTKNIYSKLGVSNRRAAVRRAAELHLL